MSKTMVAVDVVETKILEIRGRKVMLDRDLAQLYGVETKYLTRQVRRNAFRFPGDFMFKLTRNEYKEILRCQIGTLEQGKYSKYLPYVFTEQGVAMLSSVLSSARAIQVNIAIMRAFVRMREMALSNKDIAAKIEALELKYKNHDMKLAEYDKHIGQIFEAIRQLMIPAPVQEKPKIGFHP